MTSEEIRDALREPLIAILNCIKHVIEHCKPELVADLADTGSGIEAPPFPSYVLRACLMLRLTGRGTAYFSSVRWERAEMD